MKRHPERSEGSLGTSVPWEDKKESVPREDPVGGCHPEPQGEGSLGACAPRDDIPGRCPERSERGRRPERSEECLAIARQDKREVARQDKVEVTFLNSPLG